MILSEIEIGPHFLTLYSSQYAEMLESAVLMYRWFIKEIPELASIQQKDFKHEPNDPNVYHPFGIPNDIRKEFRHFHIRYGRKCTEADINKVLSNLDKGNIELSPTFKITELVSNRSKGYEHLVYPDIESDYLTYIDKLRTGSWITREET